MFFNFFLAFLVAVQGPLLMMSQNRQTQKERLHADADFAVNLKNETGINRILFEIADLRADGARLQPVLSATGGGLRWLGNGAEPALPELRRVAPGRDTQGSGWIGLRRNGDHTVTGISAVPLLPPWLALPLVLGAAVLAWRREGR